MNFCSGLILLIISDKIAHQKSGIQDPQVGPGKQNPTVES